MKIIGITGPIGAGKSYISDMFKSKGISSIDTDEVYHQLVSCKSPTTEALALAFGYGILNSDGSLNRPELAKIVFYDSKKLELLNSITHSHVKERTVEIIEKYKESGENAIVLEVPLMFESGFDKLCDTVIGVVADDGIRINRIIKRNGFTEEEAKKRIKNQKNNEFYIEKSNYIVYNNSCDSAKEDFERIFTEIFGT